MDLLLSWKQFQLLLHIAVLSNSNRVALAAFGQADENQYLSNFDAIQGASYAVADGDLPLDLDVCKNNQSPPTREVIVQASSGLISSSGVSGQCGNDSVCIIPIGTTLQVDTSLNLGALIVRGFVEWSDSSQAHPSAFLCAGYVAVEGHGQWDMDLQAKDAFIYVKDNGAVHDHLRSRAFGSYAAEGDYPIIDINGREMTRTWSLLSKPIQVGDNKITLMHNAHLMGWRVGDRIGIAPTEKRTEGHGEEFNIIGIDEKGALLLDRTGQYDHAATFVPPPPQGNVPALMSAEVVNLSRNIVITGDDFKHVSCDPSLPEAVSGEETSVLGCRCSSFRSKCTLGLHTIAMHGGSARIQNTRVERCGQRGVEGKYCLHFHKLQDCPTCLFKNNAIEGSHQRGIIIHSTHSSTVDNNVLYNVRGAGLYIEDGNEMHNALNYNIVICPFPFDSTLHGGCTVPGTSNRIADTSDNQSGIFTRAATNSLSGNRVSNSFNGMMLKEGSIGRGSSYDKVCESAAKLARYEGNTFHGNGRFGTYTLGFNYAKATDQSILTDGHNIDKDLCSGFDEHGYERGVSASIVDNVDYGNAFVGHYMAGDIQYNGHHSYGSNELLYWKETKNFNNGCSAHITGGSYARGNVALPDQATFLIENTVFGQGVSFEANHHCNVGTTGILCFPTYMFHDVHLTSTDTSGKWMRFQTRNDQKEHHDRNQNHGGIFTLSPPNAQHVMNGGTLEHSIFPPGFVSLVSSRYDYLLSLPEEPCILSTEYGQRYDGGILCKVPLRALKVYSRDQSPESAPNLKVEIWYNKGEVGVPDKSQIIGFHQTGSRGPKQGYSLPVIPSVDHSYRLSLTTHDGNIPTSWVVEFSDFVVGNRFMIEYINLSLNGRSCGQNGLVSSHHDRRFMWSGDEFMADEAWGNTGACAVSQPSDFPPIDCSSINNGLLPATECPDLCSDTCDEITTYCDCGSATCKLKPGFTETVDLCDAARCGEHGTCSAQYLGGELPVTKNACICDQGWSGNVCQHNPCETPSKTCSGRGTCVATSDTGAMCTCDDGFTGDDCQESCDGVCTGRGGVFPYGCPTSGYTRYGCKGDGCYLLHEGEEYSSSGVCTYKQEVQDCSCESDNECELKVSCNPDGSCPLPQYLPDSTPCNSVPFGICQTGTCADGGAPIVPTKDPTHAPTKALTSPTLSPSKKPTLPPSNQVAYCGCNSCDQQVWDLMVTDSSGMHSCGGRISWMQSNQGFSESQACTQVASEFPDQCFCDPTTCSDTPAPTPTPTTLPTALPSLHPTAIQTTHCGCNSCTQEVWDSMATDAGGTHSCGGRISWLQSNQSYTQAGACEKVSSEFPDICLCNTATCTETPRPTTRQPSAPPSTRPTIPPTDEPTTKPIVTPTQSPSKSPSTRPTFPPTNQPTSSPSSRPSTMVPSKSPTSKPTPSQVESHCGCSTCNEVWNEPVTDGAGTFTCGERISYLQTIEGGSKSEYDSCKQIAEEFPSDQCGPMCNPAFCNSRLEDPDPSKLIWSDEFDLDGAPDPSKWTYDLGDGCDIGLCNWGNGEVAYYTKSPNNVFVSNGVLHVAAKEESGFSLPYTSTRMITRGLHTFKYGRIQFRANLAKCKAVGTWPALWMLPEDNVYGGWPNSGEIDVMEAVGHEADKFYGTVHTSSYNGMIGTQKGNSISKSKNDWYTFEINWEQDRIQFAVDGQIYFEYSKGEAIDWPFDQDFHLIMNIAVGGSWGGQQGIDTASFEGAGQIMEVDWVRVYADTNQPQPTKQPAPSPPSQLYCGCQSCTQQVWDSLATDGSGSYSCGARIAWLQSAQGQSENQACAQVASDFPATCHCDPSLCIATPAPTRTPTAPPSKKPTSPPIVTYCGCNSCTQEVWDTLVTDAGGTYSCGARISWLQSAQGHSEASACEAVSGEFLDLCTCDPTSCNSANFFG